MNCWPELLRERGTGVLPGETNGLAEAIVEAGDGGGACSTPGTASSGEMGRKLKTRRRVFGLAGTVSSCGFSKLTRRLVLSLTRSLPSSSRRSCDILAGSSLMTIGGSGFVTETHRTDTGLSDDCVQVRVGFEFIWEYPHLFCGIAKLKIFKAKILTRVERIENCIKNTH